MVVYHFCLKEWKLINSEKKICYYIRASKQALNHSLVLKKVHRVIKFDQKTWLKSYIDMNTKLKTEAKNDFEKYFF